MASSPSSAPPQRRSIIRRSRGLTSIRLWELWEYRDLLYFLVVRDIKVRYKQTALGAAWALLQPFMMMVIFTVVFGYLAKIPSDGVPYPVFALVALLPWQLFSHALQESSNSLIANQSLVTKVYFPRLLIPLSPILSGLLDFVIAFVMLLVLLLYYGITPRMNILALPFFVLFALVTALSVGLWLSALNVKYRDVRYTVPFLTQIWLYCSPVAYSTNLIPEHLRWLYGLNPLAGVIEGFRWALFGHFSISISMLMVSIAAVGVLFFGGLFYFSHMERTFADLV